MVCSVAAQFNESEDKSEALDTLKRLGSSWRVECERSGENPLVLEATALLDAMASSQGPGSSPLLLHNEWCILEYLVFAEYVPLLAAISLYLDNAQSK